MYLKTAEKKTRAICEMRNFQDYVKDTTIISTTSFSYLYFSFQSSFTQRSGTFIDDSENILLRD